MARRDKTFLLRLSSKEHTTLKRNAAKMGMSVSKYIRFAAIKSENLKIVTIDTTPLKTLSLELTRHGVNLNQFMKFLNTYGVDAYNEKNANQILATEGEAFLRVMDALADLRREAAKRQVYILDEENSDGKNGESD